MAAMPPSKSAAGERRIASKRPALIAIAVLLVALAAAAPTSARPGVMSERLVRLTNERYNHDCLWGGPRGGPYGELPNAQPIQKGNLYPDLGATYFGAQIQFPAGAYLSFTGRFPYARYMSWAIETPVGQGQRGGGDQLRDDEIRAAPGSRNPFLPRNRRDVRPRAYAIRVVSGTAPAHRPVNTLYTGSTDPTAVIQLVLRFYVPDRGRDGTGDAGLPKLTLHLAGGATEHGQAACRTLHASKRQVAGDLPVSLWEHLIATSSDPVNAPVPYPPVWERFWNVGYSVLGTFLTNPIQRAQMYPPVDNGAFGANPDTRYLTTGVSLKHGPVYTVTGRMPTFPRTYAGTEAHEPAEDVRYWSVCTGSAPTSAIAFDCVYDEQVALRHGRYTIVVSRPGDRPRNATAACGYTWLNFGRGEDNPGGTGRRYIDYMYMRFMDANPHFTHAPQDVKVPGTEPQVMGRFYPRGAYSSVAAFEKRGCTPARGTRR
jgi:hypothetical protein